MPGEREIAQALLTNYEPSLRDRAGNAIYDVARALGMGSTANRMRNEGTAVMDFIPGVGEVLGVNDAMNDFNAGNYGMAAAGLGLTAVGAVPGVGDAAAAGVKKGIKAYHGSPHSFDRFSMDKIGTGEGAQAYGHGLYFAENEGVAQSYRDSLRGIDYDGKTLSPGDADWYFAQAALEHPSVTQADADYISSNFTEAVREGLDIDKLERNFLSNYKPGDGMHEAIRSVAAEARKAKMQAGSMYEVNINADPYAFLDWDAPLSEQSAPVQEYFRQRMDKVMPGREGWDPDGDTLAKLASPQSDLDGRDWLDTGPQEWAAQQMREAGIPGIRYLDQGSRSAGGTRNYVVFDDSLIEIVRKYGLAGAVAAGLISQEMAEQMEQQGMGEI
jgi:hypothetical protein